MKRFKVAVYARPLMSTSIEVEAASEEEAKQLAYDRVYDDKAAFDWCEPEFDRRDIQGPEECEIVEPDDDESADAEGAA